MAKLYFYFAAMNAGKSTTLLQADFNYRERGMETMLWTAAHDDRSGTGRIGSRLGLTVEANAYSAQVDLFEGSAALLALADALVELKAVCECGENRDRLQLKGRRGAPAQPRPGAKIG